MKKYLPQIIGAIALLLLGAWLSNKFWAEPEERTSVDATVLLERVREVCKLVTVEGDVNELYNETNIREVTLYLPIPVNWDFAREALIEVKATVLVGYDMKNVQVAIDGPSQQIRITNLPQPEILAIDHEVIYRNIEESYFNKFTPEDYTQLNKNAKEMIRKKVYEGDLLKKARDQGNGMLETIRFMGESMGYEVVFEMPPLELPLLDVTD